MAMGAPARRAVAIRPARSVHASVAEVTGGKQTPAGGRHAGVLSRRSELLCWIPAGNTL